MWNGDVSLTHLELKTQTWSLGCGLWLSVVHGYVDNCRIQVPWAQLQSGGLSLVCNEVNIVLRIFVDDSVGGGPSSHPGEGEGVTPASEEFSSRRQQAEDILHSLKKVRQHTPPLHCLLQFVKFMFLLLIYAIELN